MNSFAPRIALAALVVSSLLGSLTARPAAAQADPLWPRLALTGGAYSIDSDDTIRLDASATVEGTAVDLSADLGLPDSQTVATFGLEWSPAPRHSVTLGYTAQDRAGSQTFERVFRVRDVVFPVGARMESTFDTTAFDAFYSYWFVRRQHFGVAASLGVSYLQIDASVRGTARFGGSDLVVTRSVDASTEAPVPMVGLSIKGSPWERVVLRASGRYLPHVTIGDIDGEAATFSLGVDVRVAGPLSLGVGYESSSYTVDFEDTRWRGAADLTSRGLKGLVRLSF